MTLKATFQSADNNWQNDGSTTYWFDVSFDVFNTTDEEYKVKKMILGVVESGSDEPCIVDDEGHPISGIWFECHVSDLPEHITDEIRETLK